MGQDPGEENSFFADDTCAEAVSDLTAKLDGFLSRYGPEPNGASMHPQVVVDERTKEALRARGYIR